jgi:hypothetical protein
LDGLILGSLESLSEYLINRWAAHVLENIKDIDKEQMGLLRRNSTLITNPNKRRLSKRLSISKSKLDSNLDLASPISSIDSPLSERKVSI